jgi:hypothetical protein
VDDDECLNVLQAEDTTHDSVDLHDAVSFLGLVFLLEQSEAESDKEVCPSPEGEVSAQSKETGFFGNAAEPLVGKVLGGECEEDGVGKELAGSKTHSLSGTGVGEVGR